ncbi:protein transport protein Sec24A [Onthophagus taurus]|uniref:protein transport protein Sec24A n=1 Tax=Onthophagus taurus TaxID=166361 RepID=UPI0039BE03E8
MNENLPNGIPGQHDPMKSSPRDRFVPFNGVESSHSSRDSSPSLRTQIPLSQLPTGKMEIPPGQLPPKVSNLTGQMGRISLSKPSELHTPFSSPNVFTSTPVLEATKPNLVSPIGTPKPKEGSAFTHSSTSQFASVKNIERNEIGKEEIEKNVSSFFNKSGINGSLKDLRNMDDFRQGEQKLTPSNVVPQPIKMASQPNLMGNQFTQQPRISQPNLQGNILQNTQQNVPQPIKMGSQPNLMSNQGFQHQNIPQQIKMNQFQTNLPTQNVPNQQFGLQQPQNQQRFQLNQQSFSGPQINPQIQPHLQHPQQINQGGIPQANFPQGNVQQMRMPPPKSNSFPQLGQNVPAINSDQNKAHLHTNRYPQNNFNQNQPSGYQNQPQTSFHNQPTSQGFQNQPQSGFPNQSQSGFPNQPQSGFPNQPQSGFPNQPQSNFQNKSVSGFQNQPQQSFQNQQQGGYQNQPQSAFQNQPQSGFQNQPQSGFQVQSQAPYQNRVTQSGFNKLWGNENFDLLQCPNILPPTKVEAPKINLGQEFLNAANCSADIFRCTMTKIPESTTLLQKSRLPLGVLIHPFKDLSNLPVIQCNTIVRCRTCRTYINPFVFFVDSKRWKCNLCYRVNELPEEFQYDPVSKTYGDPARRPEVRSSTIEYIAPAEYMLRPPQPAIYLYLFDVSRLAVETGYLHTVCNVLSAEIQNIPGDARTQIGFLCYDSCLHFYSLAEGQNQPHEMTVLDIDDVFIPCPDNLLVNLKDRIDLITDLLSQLPMRFSNTNDTNSALGAALQAAHKMTSPTGGRVTVFQTILPNKGPGAVVSREDPNQRSSNDVHHLNPANDFYKRLALECSGQQIAVDLFILNSQYVDLATISGISRFSGGCIYHFPLFKASRIVQNDHFERSFRRYVTRKIGFEAVMRVRCTRGLSIHTFHGNLFVRSTDLLSLPNINPDAGFGMQVSIEENLSDVQTICFQAALLYTSSKGERRIRVHTLCLPIGNTLHDIMNSADQQCIVGLLAKMAVDRSMQSSLLDAREAFLNVAIDILTSYKIQLNLGSSTNGLMAPNNLRLLPLYISALLKSVAFRVGTSTRLDDRVRAMCDMKTKPLPYLIQQIYPDLYPVHNLEEHSTVLNDEEEQIHLPPHLQLTARNLDSNGAYLMDMGEHILLFICASVSQGFLKDVLDCNDFNSIPEDFYEFPTLDNAANRRMQMFLNYLNDEKPFLATFQVIKDNSPQRVIFLERLIEDRLENSLSYHEFLQHIKTQVK